MDCGNYDCSLKEQCHLEKSTFERSHGGKQVSNESRYSPIAKQYSSEFFHASFVVKPVHFYLLHNFTYFTYFSYYLVM